MTTTSHDTQQAQDLTEYRRAIGHDLRNLRRSRGWTLQALSDAVQSAAGLHIATMSLSRIESGARDLRVPEALALALALDVSPAELLTPSRPDDPGSSVPVAGRRVRWDVARRWAAGEVPLLASVATELDGIRHGLYEETEHRPAPHALDPMGEIAWQVRRSTPHRGSHRICVESAYGRVTASVDGGSAEAIAALVRETDIVSA